MYVWVHWPASAESIGLIGYQWVIKEAEALYLYAAAVHAV